MAIESNNFMNHLCHSVAYLLGEIVAERSIPLIRSNPQVVLTAPFPTSQDFHLCLLGRQLLDEDKGSFSSASTSDGILVFRNPVRVKLSFALIGTGVSRTQSLKANDRLTSYFFDTRAIEPFLPQDFQRYPALFERMRATKVELRMRDQLTDSISSNLSSFVFGFDYAALYHSGNPLREEQRVKTRIIDFNSDSNERSVL